MIKKGTIAIRLRETRTDSEAHLHTIGVMYQAVRDDNNLYYNSSSYLYTSDENFRLATEAEIEAYNKGCRHLDDIDKYTQPEDLFIKLL